MTTVNSIYRDILCLMKQSELVSVFISLAGTKKWKSSFFYTKEGRYHVFAKL